MFPRAINALVAGLSPLYPELVLLAGKLKLFKPLEDMQVPSPCEMIPPLKPLPETSISASRVRVLPMIIARTPPVLVILSHG